MLIVLLTNGFDQRGPLQFRVPAQAERAAADQHEQTGGDSDSETAKHSSAARRLQQGSNPGEQREEKTGETGSQNVASTSGGGQKKRARKKPRQTGKQWFRQPKTAHTEFHRTSLRIQQRQGRQQEAQQGGNPPNGRGVHQKSGGHLGHG